MKYLFTICLLCIGNLTFAQVTEKKVINNSTYDDWKSLKNENWTPSGQFISYEINPAKGDGYLHFKATDSDYKDSAFKGTDASLHFEDKFAVFKIKPGYDTIRQLKLDKVKPNKFPKDTLGIMWFKTDSILKFPMVKSYKLAEEGDWLAYQNTKDKRADCPTYKKWQIFKKKRVCDRDKTTGFTLNLMNPVSGQSETIHQVTKYMFDKNGQYLAYITSYKGDDDSLNLMVYDLNKQTYTSIINKQLAIKSFHFDDNSQQLVFLTSADTNDIKTFKLGLWTVGDDSSNVIVDTLKQGLNEGWAVSEYKYPYFSKDSRTIYFGTNLIVEQEPEDSLLATEKAKVDVWSWSDKKLQPQQLLELNREKKRSFLTSYNLDSKKLLHLEGQKYERAFINTKHNSENALIMNTKNQQNTYSWAYPWLSNYDVINLSTGERQNIIEDLGYFPTLSPSGQFLAWYNGKDSTWMGTNVKTKVSVSLTETCNDIFYSDNNGNPYNPFPEGSRGWVKDSNGKEKVIVTSKYDIWLLDPTNIDSPKCLTQQLGKNNEVMYILSHFDRDSAYVKLDRTMLRTINQNTKKEGVTFFNELGQTSHLLGDHTFSYIAKAKKSDKLFYRNMSVSKYLELSVTDLKFENSTQLTHTNPQQKDYNWATVEPIKWQSYKGLELDGLLYKPENFDSTKSYPMIVYFYEKYDDRVHVYYSPKPTASIVYPTEYASNGYLVFIPNIHYTPGHPAQSAYDCILSGTDYLTKKHAWIDSTKLGLQGQSWGGYQTAQLVTMTDKYACGMAGAPVSNMFSAYGGIRWGSGMSRMFQYERSQSRIGCTIWECPELYIENSPIFGLPKVNTPLLMMHNDGDGAVPWYQGIEMFVGLRRLDKPVWLLNYNGDEHNLKKIANKEDLSLRMRQFFDYYLKNEPIPLWMKNGVSAIDKGDPANLKLDSE